MATPKPSQAPAKKPVKVGPPTVDALLDPAKCSICGDTDPRHIEAHDPVAALTPGQELWGKLSAREQKAYIAHLRQTADDVDAGVGATAASWSFHPKAVQRAFAQALRREANKLDHETPTKK